MANYFKTEDNRIFMYREKHNDYLLCTPSDNSITDRRFKFEDLKCPKKINKAKAKFEINEQFRNTTTKWKHNGKKYRTGKISFNKVVNKTRTCTGFQISYIEYKDILKESPYHEFKHSYIDNDGTMVEYSNRYKLGVYQGKLIWINLEHHYLPNTYYYRFESIDKDPAHNFCGWTNINCIKPVYCITDKKYI